MAAVLEHTKTEIKSALIEEYQGIVEPWGIIFMSGSDVNVKS